MADFPAHLFRMEGDPSAIRSSAGRWSSFGTAAAEAGGAITRLDTGEFVGPEGDQFREGLNRDMPRHLQVTGEAFGKVSGALTTFASTLESLQDQMRPLAHRAPGLWAAVQSAQGRVDRAEQADKKHGQEVADRPAESTEPDPYHSDTSAASTALSQAQRDWQNCVDQANGLRTRLTTAVHTCTRVIVEAKGMRFKENPKWYDIGGQFTNFVRDNKELLKKLSGALKIVSLVAGLLSFIPVLAPIMGPIAIGSALLAGAIDLSIYAATGEGDLTMILIDIGLTLLPGIGKLAGAGLRAGAPQLMSRASYLIRSSGAYRGAMAFGATRVGRFVTAPGRLLNRANDALVGQLNKTRAGQALVNLSERGAKKAEQAFVNNRLREVDDATRERVLAYRDSLPTKEAGNRSEALQYQRRNDVAGPTEYNLQHPGDEIDLRKYQTQWADGVDADHAAIVDAKYSKSEYGYSNNDSPMRYNSGAERWESVRDGKVSQMQDYADRLASPNNPLQTMIVKTNASYSVEYWADIMNEAGIRNGVVVVVP
ncbi:putative T7SS-secreted protein [Planosporangium sp. 12N6]|uniref:putative T7SS-secreted protein n=1 Tax=Planosporangium spinosum TaxID=3402278 RepID=UPI003CE71034